MELREISPEEVAVQDRATAGVAAKIKGFQMPKLRIEPHPATIKVFQKRPEPVIQKEPVAVTEPVYQEPPVEKPIPTPRVEMVRSVDTLPQIKIPVKQSWELPKPKMPRPQIDSVANPYKKPAIPQVTRPKPIEPLYFEQPEPVIVEQPVAAPVTKPYEYSYLSPEDAYGKKAPFRLPSFFHRSPRPVADPVPVSEEVIPEQESRFKFKFDMKKMGRLIVQCVIGIIMIFFGLTSTGSYYLPASRVAGDLATWFYTYQLGTLLAIVGVVLIYDAVRKAGKL